MWNIINDCRNKKDNDMDNSKFLAEEFNDYFKNIPNLILSQLKSTSVNSDFIDYLTNNVNADP